MHTAEDEAKRQANWKPANDLAGEMAHTRFNEWLPTIGYSPGRDIPPRKGPGKPIASPDGFTPDGYPVELKSEYKVRSRGARGQLLNQVRCTHSPYGEMWVWRRDGDTFRFERLFRLYTNGNIEETTPWPN